MKALLEFIHPRTAGVAWVCQHCYHRITQTGTFSVPADLAVLLKLLLTASGESVRQF